MAKNLVVFEDGEAFYAQLENEYIRHSIGYFILAPTGAGKTHFCKAQKERHWIDGDELWISAGAQPHPTEQWWSQGPDIVRRIDQRSDVITAEARSLGFWIIGASNYWLRPDAIVIPDWETHVSYIGHRQHKGYDGGATLDDLDRVRGDIEAMKKWHTEYGVPLYQNIEAATANFHEVSK